MTPMDSTFKRDCHPERIRQGCAKDLNVHSGDYLNSPSTIAHPSSSTFNSRLSTVDSPQ